MHGEIKKIVVTFWVMRHFFILQGAPRACTDFCDPTAVSRLSCCGFPQRGSYGKKKLGAVVCTSWPCSALFEGRS
jgi:hypothetical protein